ncbi:MAG: hypothetical protein ACTSQJ_08675 [Promethearchaeota archaeon]
MISKVLEIPNCDKEILLEAIYNSTKFWEKLSPVYEIKAKFIAPNVLFTKFKEKIQVINIIIEMEGELVLIDKGEVPGKGSLIEFNVRNNKDIKKLEGNLRIKKLPNENLKVGIFINEFILNSDFLNLLGKSTSEMILRIKITDLLRNLEKYCKNNKIENLL